MSRPNKVIAGESPFRCIGLGRIFGHRFEYPCTIEIVASSHCLRCGMPRGGWKPAQRTMPPRPRTRGDVDGDLGPM